MALTPYWQQQVDPFYGGARTIGAGIARIPMMRAMAANRAAQGQFYTAHAEQERAAAEEATARQAQIQQAIETQFGKTSSGTQFSKTLARILPIMSDPSSTTEARRQAASDAMSDFGQLAADKPDEALKTFEAMEQLGRNNPGDFTQNFIAMNGGKLPTGNDALSDQQLAAAQDAKIAQETRPPAGQLSSRVITIKHPAVPDKAAVPGPTHWLKPNEPGTPAVPGTPEWTEEIKGPTDGSPTALTQFSQDPRLGPVLKQILPGTQTANSPGAPDTGTPALQTSTATVQPQGIRVRNKKTGQLGTQLPDGSVIPDQAQ